jgi:cyanate lyase
VTAHPAWCRLEHSPGRMNVHSAKVGEVFATDRASSVLVELNDLNDGQGAHVTVGVTAPEGYADAALPAEQARQVAALLGLGADVLAGRARLARHAFTVERTNGDAFVWRCRCGFVLVQDSADVPVQADLIAHATGEGR